MKRLLLFLLLTSIGHSQTWFDAGIPEGVVITASKGASFRIGSPASVYAIDVTENATIIHHAGDESPEIWLGPVTLTADTTFTATTSYFSDTDPLFGVIKSVQVLETATPQTFTYTTAASATPVTVNVPGTTPPVMINLAPWIAPQTCYTQDKPATDAVTGKPIDGYTDTFTVCRHR